MTVASRSLMMLAGKGLLSGGFETPRQSIKKEIYLIEIQNRNYFQISPSQGIALFSSVGRAAKTFFNQ
jgi:hypothetical protein